MSTIERRRDRAARIARELRLSLGAELRRARRAAGLSLSVVAASSGLSIAELSRIERGLAPWVNIETVCRVAASVGLVLSARLYPEGSPIRDASHHALLERLRLRLHSSLRWHTEVPLPVTGDLRAWDAAIRGSGWWVAVEAETRLHDLQALERRLALKRRDGGAPAVILLVNETRANRDVLLAVAPSLRETFPLGGRELLAALRAGREPAGSGLVLL